MHGEIGAGPGQSASESETDGELVRQSDHGCEQHLVRTSPAAKIADGLNAKREVVIVLVTHAAGITKTRTTAAAGDKADEVEHEPCPLSEIAFQNEPVMPATLPVTMNATVGAVIVATVTMRHDGARIRTGARLVRMGLAVVSLLLFGKFVTSPKTGAEIHRTNGRDDGDDELWCDSGVVPAIPFIGKAR